MELPGTRTPAGQTRRPPTPDLAGRSGLAGVERARCPCPRLVVRQSQTQCRADASDVLLRNTGTARIVLPRSDDARDLIENATGTAGGQSRSAPAGDDVGTREAIALAGDRHLMTTGPDPRRRIGVGQIERRRQRPLPVTIHQERNVLDVIVLIA